MSDSASDINETIYQAPIIFMALFYIALTVWTGVSVFLIFSKPDQIAVIFRLMIIFVILMTWRFSLGIFYNVKIDGNGDVRLKSFRKTLQTHCRDIVRVEGPSRTIGLRLLGFGFIRFQLRKEKIHVFFKRCDAFRQCLAGVRKSNPDLALKNIPRDATD